MVVLIIEVHDFIFFTIDPEGYPPVAGDSQAPRAFFVTGEMMGPPTGYGTQFLRIFNFLQVGDNVSYFLHIGRMKPGGVIALDETLQTLGHDIPDSHGEKITEMA